MRHASVWLLVAACVGIELVLIGSDHRLWGSPNWRPMAYQYGGFWAGLLRNWQPNFTLQPLTMFVTYGFLHGGLWHMGLNMVTLVSLGRPLVNLLGQARFLALYLLSMLGGALGFALISFTYQPMVGDSGALFGLAAALVRTAYVERRASGVPRRAALVALAWPLALLVILNLVMLWAMQGQLAWAAHLGGFVAGWITIAALDRRRD